MFDPAVPPVWSSHHASSATDLLDQIVGEVSFYLEDVEARRMEVRRLHARHMEFHHWHLEGMEARAVCTRDVWRCAIRPRRT